MEAQYTSHKIDTQTIVPLVSNALFVCLSLARFVESFSLTHLYGINSHAALASVIHHRFQSNHIVNGHATNTTTTTADSNASTTATVDQQPCAIHMYAKSIALLLSLFDLCDTAASNCKQLHHQRHEIVDA
jgi:phospholipid N-methyltransferase